MKSLILSATALLFAAASFAQTHDHAKNGHSAKVSSTTKSTTDADIKGNEVSTAASSKSQAELHKKNSQSNENKAQRRTENTEVANDELKSNHGAVVSGVAKSTTEGENHGTAVSTVASSKSQAEFNRKNGQSKELREENNEAAKELKASAKADLKAEREALKDAKADLKGDNEDGASVNAKARKEARVGDGASKNTRVKTGAKAGANVGVGQGGVKTKVGAGLKLGL